MSGAVAFIPTPRDWVVANRLWYRRSRQRRWLTWIGVGALVVAALKAIVDLAILRQGVAETIADVMPMIFFAAIITAAPMITLLLVPRQVRRQFAQRPGMADEVRYAWSDQGLEASTRTGQTHQPWSELHRQLRDECSFIFLMTDQLMLLIPRRALSDEQADDLAATVDRFGPVRG